MTYILDDTPVEAGDVVIGNTSTSNEFIKGEAYLVKLVRGDTYDIALDSNNNTTNGWDKKFFNKIKTLPGHANLKGDIGIYLGYNGEGRGSAVVGKTYTSRKTDNRYFYWNDSLNNRNAKEWLILLTVNNINNEGVQHE